MAPITVLTVFLVTFSALGIGVLVRIMVLSKRQFGRWIL